MNLFKSVRIERYGYIISASLSPVDSVSQFVTHTFGILIYFAEELFANRRILINFAKISSHKNFLSHRTAKWRRFNILTLYRRPFNVSFNVSVLADIKTFELQKVYLFCKKSSTRVIQLSYDPIFNESPNLRNRNTLFSCLKTRAKIHITNSF